MKNIDLRLEIYGKERKVKDGIVSYIYKVKMSSSRSVNGFEGKMALDKDVLKLGNQIILKGQVKNISFKKIDEMLANSLKAQEEELSEEDVDDLQLEDGF